MKVEFTPTRNYLPSYYAKCEEMNHICDTLDDLYFKKFFDEVCIKSLIYGMFRNDLASKDYVDTDYDYMFNEVYGVSNWGNAECEIAKKFDDWPQRRICLRLLLSQFLSLPYTMKNITEFVDTVESILHYYNSKYKWLTISTEKDDKHIVALKVMNETDNIPEYKLDLIKVFVADMNTILPRVFPCNIDYEQNLFDYKDMIS